MAISKTIREIETMNLQDEVLWKEIKAGNKEAFVSLYNKYADILLKYGSQLIKDRSLIEDTIHDIFVSIWDQRGRLADVHSLKFYLMSALRRMLLRQLKKENKWKEKEIPFHDTSGVAPSFLDVNIQTQDDAALIEKIQKVLDRLSSRQKEIIYLKFYQNLSYQEIAELLDLDQKYTYNLAARAFASFKEQFVKFGIFLILSLLM